VQNGLIPAISRIGIGCATLVLLSVSARAQGASVVWSPPWPKPPYDRLEWTLTVLELPQENSNIYWAFQDGFVGGGFFYFGMQPHGGCPGGGLCKLALFSFFGKGATTTSPNCKTGADNGPGMSCHIKYKWRKGVPYKFAIQLSGADPASRTRTWTGTITDRATGVTTEIGNWTIPGQNTFQAGLIGGETVSFIEYYAPLHRGCAAEPYAKVAMSVPTGFREGTPEQGGVSRTSPAKICAEAVKFTPYPDAARPILLQVETGSKK